ncbi:ABC transporter permease subunit [Agrobacterium vitis]|uniref:ABC transporter permease subunit n=1 Tax=Agrobacterium vitis TaxID=373 RepID=A0AAE5B720_AGRVI|nr:ABC transporter permease subunit [Agrobacterium vitis]MBF2714138.1 ABC transporter permease subunit [Agrobacterium vitis]MUO81517.1 ABC transporter permease subunit [Agrobacterium vitis]MUO95836.1 ABC transporter permease subunit [Agrobacterium vitis]MVA93915.1 ABC transporter permease subunit [Agrobacterium vitis]MVB03578.1 ABC transporter permease subunit [Agrobacterium vitis]
MSGPDKTGARKIRWRGFVLPIALVLLAEVGAQVSHLQSDSLAAPSAIFVALWRQLVDGTILLATVQTLTAALAGLAIGFSLGMILGILFAVLPVFDRMFEVSVEAIRPVPPIALMPIGLLVFGFGYRLEYSIVAFATLWPALILTRSAVAGIEPKLNDVARVLRFGLIDRITKIILPAALPRIFVALRLGVGISLIVAVTVEISINTLGLGYAIMNAQQSLRPDDALALLVWIGIVGWALGAILLMIQRTLFGPAALVEGTA